MKSAAPLLVLMMMMMMKTSAGPLPPAADRSRRDAGDAGTLHLQEGGEDNSTSLEPHQNVNVSADGLPGRNSVSVFRSESSVEDRAFSCPLPTCATVNLGSSLQTGDKKAGSSTSDPWGIGKK